MQEKRAAPLVLLLCAMQGGCYLYLLSLGRLNEHMLSCQTAFFTAFALYAACLVLLSRADNAAAGGRSFLQGRGLLVAVLFFSVMFRCIVWFGEPALSDDIYRYVWEGRLSAAGINPFAYAPEHSGLMQFRDTGIFPHINNKHLPTIYPPLSQFIFALSAGISPTVGTMKAAFAFFDLATIAVLLMTLRALNLNLLQAAVYALNPLVIMEFAGSGHLDSAGIFFLMLALYCCIRKKTLPAVAALSFSFLSKFLSILFLPLLLGKKRITRLGLFFAVVGLAYVPFFSAGEQLVYSLRVYYGNWVYNGSCFELFKLLCADDDMARKAAAAVFILISGLLYLRYFRMQRGAAAAAPYRLGLVLLGTLFVLSPVLHPWYVCWIVPFLSVVPNRAWIFFSGTVFLSYWVLQDYTATGLWQEQPVVRAIEYVPFFILLLYDGLKKNVQKNETGTVARDEQQIS